MFAQSLVDFGSLVSGVDSLAYSVRSYVGNLSPATWGLIAVGVIGLLFWSRR